MIDRLRQALPENADGILITSPENRRYFTGFKSSDGLLIITKKNSVFLTDSRYIEAAAKQIKGCRVIEKLKLPEQINALSKELAFSSLLTESEKMTVEQLKQLRKAFGKIRLSSVGADKIINSLRIKKSPHELESILKAQACAELAFDHILGFIKQGVSEKDVSLELDYFMLKNGAEALSFDTVVVSGKKSSMPHGVAGDKKIEIGDFITMDFGAVVNGYHSDMTRTVALGSVSQKQRDVYQLVLKAQMNALAFVKNGVSLKAADAAARDIITAEGYGEFFRHSLGHGVGIEIHEEPALSPLRKGFLKSGSVVTIEPGIYIPEEFGVRIEDMVLITDDGALNLTKSPKDLIVL